jgi:predicted component of type VI protein secretion system
MKTSLITLFLALIYALPLWANQAKGSKDLPNDSQGETRMLQQLLKMEPAHLVNLRQTIERIEQMTSDEKEKLRKRVDELNQMRPERVKAMRERFESIPREDREAMRQRWLNLPPEERQDWHQKLRAMDPRRAPKSPQRARLFTHTWKNSQGQEAPSPARGVNKKIRSLNSDGGLAIDAASRQLSAIRAG